MAGSISIKGCEGYNSTNVTTVDGIIPKTFVPHRYRNNHHYIVIFEINATFCDGGKVVTLQYYLASFQSSFLGCVLQWSDFQTISTRVCRLQNFCSSLPLPLLQNNVVSFNYRYLSKNVVCYWLQLPLNNYWLLRYNKILPCFVIYSRWFPHNYAFADEVHAPVKGKCQNY